MPTQKIDPKVIFASDAPAIDKPPVFSDKTKGWDVARANDGRPEIKQMNKMQQDTDLKILWLNENAALPYDASIDYPDGAVAIKDGSFKQLSSGSWVEFLDDFADKDAVKRGIANRYDSSLTYNIGERVVLANGDIVKSTIDGNVTNPNVDMTGWEKPQASDLFDKSGLSQQQINDIQKSKTDFYVTPEMFRTGGMSDRDALLAADAYAVTNNLNIAIPKVLDISIAAAIKSYILNGTSQIFTDTSNVSVESGQWLCPEWWGADPTNVKESYSAVYKCLSSAKGRTVYLSGMYKVSSPLLINHADLNGLKIIGQGAQLINGVDSSKSGFNFDEMPTNEIALAFKGTRGLVLEDFHISHVTGRSDGSITVWFTEFDMFRFKGLTVESKNGIGSQALKFGNLHGGDCVFMGTVEGVEIHTNGGVAATVRNACTSIHFINCYQQNGYFHADGAIYCKFTNCASEGSPDFGYKVSGCTGITFDTCAGEANGLGVFYAERGSINIEYINPYGAGNNTRGGGTGSLIHIDGSLGANSNILISSPTAISDNVNTSSNINIFGVNGYTEIKNVSSVALPKGIRASDVFKQNYLNITGGKYPSVHDFIPTLSGFTNVGGGPSLVGKFYRSNKTVNISIEITPVTSFTTTTASTVTIPTFGGIIAPTKVDIVTNSGAVYQGVLLKNGTIKMPAMSAITEWTYLTFSINTN